MFVLPLIAVAVEVFAFIEVGLAIGWLAAVAQVKSIKDQRFSLGIKDAAESSFVLAFAVYVEHVNDMKVARAHQVMNVAPRCQQVSFSVQSFCLGA